MTAMTAEALQRLAGAVMRRRVDLRLSKDEAARRGGTTNTTWTRVEKAQSVRDTTYATVETVLGWDSGACLRIAAGGDPAVEAPAAEPQQLAETDEAKIWRHLPAREELRGALQSAAIAVVPEATGAQIQELQRRLEEELVKRMERRKDRG